MMFTPVYLIVLPIMVSLLVYLIKRPIVHALVFGAQAVLTGLALTYFFTYYAGGVFAAPFFVVGGWHARIGISLYVDALGIAFVFLTIFIWWMVWIYLYDRRRGDYQLLFFLMFLQGVFLGLVQTNDLFNLFVFVELTTIIVTILIAYKKSGQSFRAAIYYLLLNTSGVLMFLIGIILLYNTFGTINMNYIAENLGQHAEVTAIRYAFVLMMAGVSVKSALFPVFTWLPKAHGSAQSVISALLSGLIVKGGVYIFIRMQFMFADVGFNTADFFFAVGVVTALSGILFALSQKDLKQMLAYSTVSQIGLIIIGLSSPDIRVFYGGVYHMFNHALFKALLFMGVGIIIKVFHRKKVDELQGVFMALPHVSIAMIIGMLAITGAPLLNGFISKSVILYGFTGQSVRYWILFGLNIATATLFVKMAGIFIGPQQLCSIGHRQGKHLALLLLSIGCIVLGNAYIPLFQGLFSIDVSDIRRVSFGALFDYGVTLSLAGALYWLIIRKDLGPMKTLRNFKLSFETANFLFVGYIVVMVWFFIVL
ncbi:MAG: hypothetical protein EA374_07230 [Acholeplasmatales bacterium]|nr:MAG: hypothetical protein EA374_07230 [Acholeplasmatales bacterium]